MENIRTFLRTRRSIRRFKPDPVPDTVLKDILYTATYAPSAHNRQPWRFIVLTDPSAKKHLSDAMTEEFQRDLEQDNLTPDEVTKRVNKSRERINGAPVVIILCVDMSEMDNYPDERRRKAEYIIGIQSAANAGMQLLLAAHAEGLGGVWVCSPMFAQEIVQEALNISNMWEPQAMFLLGYPVEIPAFRGRKPIEEVVEFSISEEQAPYETDEL
ncbi:MAG: nitroreductase family protein [Anaerolineales bacterium]|nr:nitroreductase family protein [Anaerolineales bacterium]